jgi:hypothetical protein
MYQGHWGMMDEPFQNEKDRKPKSVSTYDFRSFRMLLL